jgi:hypothetical protein
MFSSLKLSGLEVSGKTRLTEDDNDSILDIMNMQIFFYTTGHTILNQGASSENDPEQGGVARSKPCSDFSDLK